jgi:hypothetical protein
MTDKVMSDPRNAPTALGVHAQGISTFFAALGERERRAV